MKYKIFDTNRSIFDDDIIVEANTMKDAVRIYLGDRLKMNQHIEQYDKGQFVVNKYPYGRRYVFAIFNN